MRIEVDVKRIDQSHDLNTGEAQNYLVFDLFGVEHRVPCSEAVVLAAVREIARLRGSAPVRGVEPPATEEDQVTTGYVDEQERRTTPAPLFVQSGSPDLDLSDLPPNVTRVAAQQAREDAPDGTGRTGRALTISRAPRIVQPQPHLSTPTRKGSSDDAGISQG